MCMCIYVCVLVDGWLKKGLYLQHLLTATDCLEDVSLSGWFLHQNRQRNVPHEPSRRSETGSRVRKKQRTLVSEV